MQMQGEMKGSLWEKIDVMANNVSHKLGFTFQQRNVFCIVACMSLNTEHSVHRLMMKKSSKVSTT